MNVTVNGETRELEAASTVRDLLVALGPDRTPVAVERNRQVVRKRDHESTRLEDGDHIELVTLVGGG